MKKSRLCLQNLVDAGGVEDCKLEGEAFFKTSSCVTLSSLTLTIVELVRGAVLTCQMRLSGSTGYIQLNVYDKTLERYYDCKVAGMFVICCHPDCVDSPFVDRVPDLSFEAGELLPTCRDNAMLEDARGGASFGASGVHADAAAHRKSQLADQTDFVGACSPGPARVQLSS